MKLTNNIKLKDKILNDYNQVTLFSKYLNIPETEIEKCLLNKHYKTLNLHRGEKDASLGFMRVNDKVISKDFADSRYNGDIFSLVGLILDKNTNYNKDFVQICNHIIRGNIEVNKPLIKTVFKKKTQVINTIEVIPRDWNNIDKKYWTDNYFIPLDYLEENYILPLNSAFYNGTLIYTENRYNPCYAYYSGEHNGISIYKLYFPLTKKKSNTPRFKTNNISNFECFREIKKNKHLILIKSYKDKTLIDYIISRKLPTASFLSYRESVSIIPINSESIRITPKQIAILNNTYDNIVCFVDNDDEGNRFMEYHKEQYNIDTIMFGKGIFKDIKSKDISDYVKETRSIEEGKRVVINLIKHYLYE